MSQYPDWIYNRPAAVYKDDFGRLVDIRKQAYDRALNDLVDKLFSRPASNVKMKKSLGEGVYTLGLFLSPHEWTGYTNLCVGATAGCAAVCLTTSGGGRYFGVQVGKMRKTYQYLFRHEEFMAQLVKEIEFGIAHAGRMGYELAVRLNGTTDIDWSQERYQGQTLFEIFPDVNFYDYTKRWNVIRASRDIPNWFVIWSRAETPVNQKLAGRALAEGLGISVVFDGALPAGNWTWNGVPVVDGDKHDAIHLYGGGSRVFALKAKGEARKDTSGFVVSRAELEPG